MKTITIRLEALQRIYRHLEERRKFHFKKLSRARVSSSIDLHSEKEQLYRQLSRRCSDLAYTMGRELRLGKEMAQSYERDQIRREYRMHLERKEENRQKFLKFHRFAPWFMQTSLGADYGTYVCDRCGHTFYHSPSTISLAGKVVHECCCGYCTNTIISRDWDKEPYF